MVSDQARDASRRLQRQACPRYRNLGWPLELRGGEPGRLQRPGHGHQYPALVHDQGPATFEFAKRIRGSKVEYKEVSVYDLDSLEQQFDIVVFFGVLYHLRYPQLGLARIRNVLKDGGLLLMETAILLDTEDTIIQTDHQKIYPNDVSTWNAFSGPALVSLLKESYFEVERFEVIVRQNRGARSVEGLRSRVPRRA